MGDERYRSRIEMEELERVFVTQEQFGDYKQTMASTVGDIKGSVRTMKWITGLIFIGIAADLILNLLRVVR